MTRPSSTTKPAREIIVSLSDHKITVLENGVEVKSITHFSTGRQGHLTPLITNGHIAQRERIHYSHTYKDRNGKPAAMPYALFFSGGSGCAFHAGDPDTESHGCIHLGEDDAKWLFEWVGKHDVALEVERVNG